MKKLLSSLLILLAANCFASGTNLLDKLMDVNAQWKNQPEHTAVLATAKLNTPQNFNGWIATHLMLVEETLRARNVAHLTPAQQANRKRLLDELHGYWQAAVFPVNDYLTYKNPVFIDRKGTHCAVGYLMQQSGHETLARAIDANEKFAYVYEIKTPGVKQWADEFGFTVDELAWIQPGYPPSIPSYDLDGGLDNTVNVIVADTVSQVVYVGGSFNNSISGVSCSGIAMWINGFAGWDWAPVGTGVNGEVYGMMLHNNKLYVGGNFTQAGSVAAKNVAVYDITSGQWQAMGQLDSTVRAFEVYNGEVYAAGTFNGFVSKWNGSSWQGIAQGFLYGQEARTLEVWDNKLVIGGNFELATGALRRHVATYDGTYMGTMGMGTLTPVNDFEVYRDTLLAGCDNANTCAIAKFDGTDWGVMLKETSIGMLSFSGEKVTCLSVQDTTLVIGGKFDCAFGGGMSTFGNNLMRYVPSFVFGGSTLYDLYGPITMVDSTINAVCVSGGNVIYGGYFVHSLSSAATLNHISNIGYNMSDYTGLKDLSDEFFKVFPNPASNTIRIQTTGVNVSVIELMDVNGKRVLQATPRTSQIDMAVSELPAGIYTVRVITANGVGVSRLVKN